MRARARARAQAAEGEGGVEVSFITRGGGREEGGREGGGRAARGAPPGHSGGALEGQIIQV